MELNGENNITKVWYDQYYKLLNLNGNISNQPYIESIMNDIIHSQSVFSRFSALNVKHAINKLKMGKSAATDSMRGEHFKYAHSKVTGYQCCLMSCFYTTIYLVSLWRLLLFLL